MELFFFYILFSVLVGFHASSKGHSGINFFVLAILLSPIIGFNTTLRRSPTNEETEDKQIASGNKKRCPECVELVKLDASVCKHCGNTFT